MVKSWGPSLLRSSITFRKQAGTGFLTALLERIALTRLQDLWGRAELPEKDRCTKHAFKGHHLKSLEILKPVPPECCGKLQRHLSQLWLLCRHQQFNY